MQQFKVTLSGCVPYMIMAESIAHARRELHRMGMKFLFIDDPEKQATLYDVPVLKGSINYDTGAWCVDLDGEMLTGYSAFPLPMPPAIGRHVELADGRSLHVVDDGKGNMLVETPTDLDYQMGR